MSTGSPKEGGKAEQRLEASLSEECFDVGFPLSLSTIFYFLRCSFCFLCLRSWFLQQLSNLVSTNELPCHDSIDVFDKADMGDPMKRTCGDGKVMLDLDASMENMSFTI